MPTYIKMPDGQTISVPDDITPKELAELQMHASAQEKSIAASKPTMTDQFLRGLGLTTRGVITGAASLPAMGADAIAAGSNALFGTKFPNQSELIQKTMTKLGIPEPQGIGENANVIASSVLGGIATNPILNNAVSRITGSNPSLYNAPPVESPRMTSLREGRAAGYKVAPNEIQEAGGSAPISRASQAIAGRTQVENMIRSQNENITNALARKSAGLQPNSPLTNEALKNAISETYKKGYEPISNLGLIKATDSYHQALDDVAKNFQGVSRSFPGAEKADIVDLVNTYKVKDMYAEDALRAIAQLRDGADSAYASGNSALGKASRAIATALEDNIEKNLKLLSSPVTGSPNIPSSAASEMLNNFRSARSQLAKQYVVKNSLVEGTGNVNAAKIGALFAKKPEYLSDELATIGKFTNAAPRLSGLPKTAPSTFTGTEGLALLGSGISTLLGGGPANLLGAVPIARAALRQGLLSNFGQNMILPAAQASGPSLMPGALLGGYALGTGLYGQ